MKSHTLKFCVTLGIFVLASIASFTILILLTKAKVAEVDATEDQTRQQVAFAEGNHSLQTLIQDISPNMTTLRSRLVASDGAVGFIEKVESLARESGLSVVVNSITTADAIPKDTFQWMQISISTQGSWAGSYQFLALLEAMPYKMTIGKINLKQSSAIDLVGAGKGQRAVSKTVWDVSYTFNVLQLK
jgi:Tfp pilus assembly protein PilO